MPSYDIFFWSAFFFLFGVLLASVGWKSGILIATILICIGSICAWIFSSHFLFLQKWKRKRYIILALLSLCIPLGALYFVCDDINLKNVDVVMNQKESFTGVVISVPIQKETFQEFVAEIKNKKSYRILVRASPLPEFSYGDMLTFEGKIEKPNPERYASYLLKERVIGVMTFPYIQKEASHRASEIQETLYNIRERMINAFQKIFPQKEATFLGGLTFGARGEFSKEFKDAMQKSGTTHIVALSGYNITIVVWAITGIFLRIFGRRFSFIFSFLVVLAFVMMAGGEASVVRAAIMGLLILLAREAGRIYDLRNAIVCAGLLMVLVNPKVLTFDVGFQLSFLALLGIVYIRPALIKIFKIDENTSTLFSWKDNLVTTSAAQLAVLPLIISQFGSVSLTSVIANVIILEAIPITMGFGFFIAGASFILYPLAVLFGWITWVLLKFEIVMIEFFAYIRIPLSFKMTLWSAIIYYGILLWFIIKMKKAPDAEMKKYKNA